ncbi:MAG: hypothetical protein Q9180_004095, partial [Flavoplaca navasiana]
IHDVLWRGENTVLKSRTAPHEVTMTDCWALCQKACTPSMLPLSQETRELVEGLMMSIIKLIRNKAAHHEQGTLTETIDQCYENALALTYFLNDEDATRKIELTTWVAQINLSLQAAEKERKVLERSVLDWEKLEVEARALGDDGSRFWIKTRAAERRLWGNEADNSIQRWTEPFHPNCTDPNCTPVDWSKPEASTGPCSDGWWDVETPNIDRRNFLTVKMTGPHVEATTKTINQMHTMCNLLSEAGAVATVVMEDLVKRINILELVIAELDTISTLQLTKAREEYEKQRLTAKDAKMDEGGTHRDQVLSR